MGSIKGNNDNLLDAKKNKTMIEEANDVENNEGNISQTQDDIITISESKRGIDRRRLDQEDEDEIIVINHKHGNNGDDDILCVVDEEDEENTNNNNIIFTLNDPSSVQQDNVYKSDHKLNKNSKWAQFL